MRVAALAPLVVALAVATGCSGQSAGSPVEASAAPATTVAPSTRGSLATPESHYLDVLHKMISSTLPDDELLYIGRTVCTIASQMTRGEAVQTIADDSTRGNREAAEILVATAHNELCPAATFATAPLTTSPAAPLISFGSGTYEVGVDVAPDKYKTKGTASCYWARLKENDGSSGDIIDNFSGEGPQTVTIRESEYFETQGCGIWEAQ